MCVCWMGVSLYKAKLRVLFVISFFQGDLEGSVFEQIPMILFQEHRDLVPCTAGGSLLTTVNPPALLLAFTVKGLRVHHCSCQ